MKPIMRNSIAMNEGTTIDPKRGQVWSLKVKDREMECPAVLLLEDPEESGDSFVALAILEESWMACDQDVLLSPDPDWLLGLGWCMAGGGQKIKVKVARDRLRAHLAEVDVLTLGLVRDFNQGKSCSLSVSDRLIPELGDRRVDGRREYLDFVRQCAGVEAWKLAIRLVKSKIEAVLSGPANEEIRPNVEPLALSPTRGSEDEDQSTTRNVITLDLPYELRIVLLREKLNWQATFEALKGDVNKLKLKNDEKDCTLERVDNEWFTEEPIPVGVGYRLVIDGELGEETVQLDLESL